MSLCSSLERLCSQYIMMRTAITLSSVFWKQLLGYLFISLVHIIKTGHPLQLAPRNYHPISSKDLLETNHKSGWFLNLFFFGLKSADLIALVTPNLALVRRVVCWFPGLIDRSR